MSNINIVSLPQRNELGTENYIEHFHYQNETPYTIKNFIEMLPKVVKEHVLKVGDSLEVPYEFPVAGLLACSSVCIGKNICVKIGARKTYANVYIITIGEQGLGKSPSIDLMIEALTEHDQRYLTQFLNDRDELLRNKKDAKGREEKQEIQEQIDKLEKIKNVVDDETVENIMGVRMVSSEKGLLWNTDELANMIELKCGGKSVTDFLIKAYSNRHWDIGRKTGGVQGDIHIDISYLSTVSTTQPATAKRLLLTPELQSNGFIARNLLSVVLADDERTPELSPYTVDDSDLDRYNEFMSFLYVKSKSLTKPIRLSESAESALDTIKYLHKVARQKDPTSVFKGFHGKMGEPVLKVALNLHMLRYADALMKGEPFDAYSISKEVIEASYGLVKHFTVDALEKLFATMSETEEDKMRETLIKMNTEGEIAMQYDPDITGRAYATFDNIYKRTRRRFNQNREMLREALRNCPNLGMLSKTQLQGKNGRRYTTEVFYISDEAQVYFQADN